jgi:glucuronate isomerase
MDQYELWRRFGYGPHREQLLKLLIYENTNGVVVDSKEFVQFKLNEIRRKASSHYLKSSITITRWEQNSWPGIEH